MYPIEELSPDEDCGIMPESLEAVTKAVIGHRIVKAEVAERTFTPDKPYPYETTDREAFVVTLDNGTEAIISGTSDCCAFTELREFWLHPESVDHIILGVGTTDGYETWHIYADFGDVMTMKVGWSCGNPFYYGYGFDVAVQPVILDVESTEVAGELTS